MLLKRQKTNVMLLGLLGVLLFAITGTVIIVPDAGKTGTCGNNFRRTAPDFCEYTGAFGTVITSGTGGCTIGTFSNGIHPVPSNASVVVMLVGHTMLAINGVGTNHVAQTNFYREADCSGISINIVTRAREMVATSAGVPLLVDNYIMYVPVVGINQFAYQTFNTGGTHSYGGRVLGFYD